MRSVIRGSALMCPPESHPCRGISVGRLPVVARPAGSPEPAENHRKRENPARRACGATTTAGLGPHHHCDTGGPPTPGALGTRLPVIGDQVPLIRLDLPACWPARWEVAPPLARPVLAHRTSRWLRVTTNLTGPEFLGLAGPGFSGFGGRFLLLSPSNLPAAAEDRTPGWPI